MGAVSTVLTLANAFVLRPPTGERPEELVVLAKHRPHPVAWPRLSYLDYVQIRDRATTLSRLAAHCGDGAPWWVIYNGHSKELGFSIVSANYFAVLGLAPAYGRFFSEAEDSVPGRDRVAVISHDVWRDGWNAAPEAVGSAIQIQGESFTVVGVAPEGFYGLHSQVSDVYIPVMAMTAIGAGRKPYTDPDEGYLQTIARIREGRTLEEVKAEAPTLAPGRWKDTATADQPALTLVAFRPRGAEGVNGDFGFDAFESGHILSIVAGACLLLGCGNLAALLLARGSARARELAIRPALGATPLRLLRQLLTESLILAAAGGTLGMLLSLALSRAFVVAFYVSTNGARNQFDLGPDLAVIASVAVSSMIAALLFGILPALRSIRLGAALAITGHASSGTTSSRLGRALIGAQVAGAVALITMVGLLLSSARRFASEGAFEPSHVALLRVVPTGREPLLQEKYPPEKLAAFQLAVLERLHAVPGVKAASAWNGGGVLDGAGQNRPDQVVVRRQPDHGAAGVSVGWKAIAPRYFDVLRAPILRGRDFAAADRVKPTRVAIVNEALARALWPGGDAIGSTLVVNKDAPAEVVGVVKDVYARRSAAPSPPQVYVPLPPDAGNRYAVRVDGNPAAALPALVRAVQEIDPDVPVRETTTMTAYLAQRDLRPIRMTLAVTTYGAALALVLGAIGIYGTLAFSVGRRSKEIGVRIAVGAVPRDIVRAILQDEMKRVAVALLAGAGLAWGASRFMRELLYGLSGSRDGALYAVAGLLVAGTALCACWLPARRAARLDPMAALKSD
jgi:predicted permease